MPRKYVPKPKTYDNFKLQEALENIKSGNLSLREAEKKYTIDKSLLWRRIHDLNTSKQGRKTVLSRDEEIDLTEKIKTMAKWGWALTRQEIKFIVHTYVVQNNIQNNFKNNYPGKDWMIAFFKRNGLVTKKLEQLEKSRRQATSDPFIIFHFYDLLDQTMTSLDLLNKPQNIWNLDETYFCSDPGRVKGVTKKGQKAYRTIQGSGKENTTVLGCASADGKLLPPLIIFKGQNLWSSWKGTNDIPGTTYACSDNGWMMTSIFNEWFANFCKTVEERPLLVIFDGHVTHLDPATIEMALRENVTLLKLPPHTTDLLQPMDRSLFGPIKYKWNEKLIEWQRLNQRLLTKSEFCNLLSEVWSDGVSEEVIKKSFNVTGLYPVNKDAYPKDRLDPEKLERYNREQSSGAPISDPLDIFEALLPENEECISPSLLDSRISRSQYVSPSLLETEPPIIQSDAVETTRPSCSFETLLLEKIKRTTPPVNKRRKIDSKGKVLTSEDYLKSIENLDKQKKKKKNTTKRKPKTYKQKRTVALQESDTDSDLFSDEDVQYADESDVENYTLEHIIDEYDRDSDVPTSSIVQQAAGSSNEVGNEVENNHPDNLVQNDEIPAISKDSTTDEEIESAYEVGNFILVEHSIKNIKKCYVARIEGIDREHFSVIYLKRSKKMFFVYPAVHIKYSVLKEEIVMKLAPPTQSNKRGALFFDIDFEKYHVE